MQAASVVVLTGAGISAESGLRTFRAADGLWEDHRIEDVASPQGYVRDPVLVHKFYNERRAKLAHVKPNGAHAALAEFEKNFAGEFLLVTQNIDDLHERAGSKKLIHMHGELLKMRCSSCQALLSTAEAVEPKTSCPSCSKGYLRPHVVWFGEMPLQMDEIYAALASCDVFIAIGTSGNVYPAAGFVGIASSAGAYSIEANLEPSAVSTGFNEHVRGKASETLGPLLAKIQYYAK